MANNTHTLEDLNISSVFQLIATNERVILRTENLVIKNLVGLLGSVHRPL